METPDTHTVNILFLGGAKRVSLAEHFIRSGQALNLEVHVFSYELGPYAPIAQVGKVIVGKRWDDNDLYQHLLDTIKNNHIDVVLPFVDRAIEICAILKTKVSNVFIPCSPLALCRTMYDKLMAENWFKTRGLPIPPSYKAGDTPKFPAILKPRKGSASQGIRIVQTQQEWELVEDKEAYVVQHYIRNNREFTVDCYVTQNRRTICMVPRQRLAVSGGEVTTSVTLRDETILDLCRKILSTGSFQGPITIQFIRDMQTLQTYVMEINPRLGGGVINSIEAGADIPGFILQEAMGQEPSPCVRWQENVLMTRYQKEVIFHHADNY